MCDSKPIILVVDDDPGVCAALKFALELENLTVHTCTRGSELLAHPHLGRACCLVLDCKIPEMDGFRILDHLAERNLDVPVILITSPVTEAIRQSAAARRCVVHILEKPLLDGALIDRVRELTR